MPERRKNQRYNPAERYLRSFVMAVCDSYPFLIEEMQRAVDQADAIKTQYEGFRQQKEQLRTDDLHTIATLRAQVEILKNGLRVVRDGSPADWRGYCQRGGIPGYADRHDDPATWWLKAMAADVLVVTEPKQEVSTDA